MGKTVISDDGRFEWDEARNEINRKKHRFGFEEITDVFDDPYFLSAMIRIIPLMKNAGTASVV